MSELDLDAVRARCEAATPGPWSAYNANEGTEYLPAWEVANDAYHNPPADEDAPWIAVHLETGVRDDAEFIAAARSDVPDLLAALASSRAEVERLRDELRDKRTDLLNVRGILSPNGFEPVTPLSLVPDVAPAVAWLVAERERMRPVVEAAKTWRWRSATHPTTPYLDATRLEAAVDTYESQGATDG